MAEYIANALQTVAMNQDVLFTDTAICSKNNSIVHRKGSGLVTLRSVPGRCSTRFEVLFGANIAIPEGGSVTPISLAIAIDGEPINSTNMIVTPAAAEQFFNIFRGVYVDIPCGCCSQISIKNTAEGSVDVKNANLIIKRVP